MAKTHEAQLIQAGGSCLLHLIVALIVLSVAGIVGFVGWQHYGPTLMAPPQSTVNSARPIAPAAPLAPRVAPFQAQPQAQPQPQAAPEPPAAQSYQPTGSDYQAPAEAVPAGAPMTDQYRETIQSQDRTNDKGELCLPRSGCTRPGSGGDLAWPNGRP